MTGLKLISRRLKTKFYKQNIGVVDNTGIVAYTYSIQVEN